MGNLGKAMSAARTGYSMVKFLHKDAKRGEPESVLKSMERYCEENRLNIIIGPEKGKILDDAVN